MFLTSVRWTKNITRLSFVFRTRRGALHSALSESRLLGGEQRNARKVQMVCWCEFYSSAIEADFYWSNAIEYKLKTLSSRYYGLLHSTILDRRVHRQVTTVNWFIAFAHCGNLNIANIWRNLRTVFAVWFPKQKAKKNMHEERENLFLSETGLLFCKNTKKQENWSMLDWIK